MKIDRLSQSAGVPQHPFPFDPAYGLDLDGLLKVAAPDTVPADFAEFWQDMYRRALATPVDPRLGAKAGSTAAGLDVFEVSFTSLGGIRIGGWIVVPPDGVVERGFVVGHGYGGRDEPAPELPATDAAGIYFVARGLPTKSLLSGVPSEAPGHVLQGIESRADYIIGGCVADLWCAATALTELFPATARRLDYTGVSFGGGTGALALPWDARFTAAQLMVPTFGNHRLRVTLECVGSGASVRERYQHDPRILDVLAYFDAATAARHVQIPVQAVPALFDPAVPPPGQFAVVNALAGPVETQVATAGHFTDYPEYEQEMLELGRATKQFFAE
ncbi:Acetyl xylan esterase [Catenulispora acidiphila DSM 44928]|uniref:Acetyl xylan esterase n=1 Tax=Catenulispora acidiphila (strain DSM 44928 / JCM 14897 / NBRC 102108 / NRRL B-24433 / ID139908) TaxID=479433 RepID=C7QDS2_CATAD|nr:acetylxylan esterase [Catenulispora acidiphila]ACU74696.1 Acetyl xylan esterase [Catenulispora acidiphila DSM 44928]